ncbi:MAG: hypothetical protein HY815_01420 [Candidatus Riflebacteria bacterium]|nr:hypothetical protein [Candidatus Riflebacteria bacterium]
MLRAFLLLTALAASQVLAQSYEEFQSMTQDVAQRADAFFRLVQSSPRRDRSEVAHLIMAARDLRTFSDQLRAHLNARSGVEVLNQDLAGMARARDGIDRWLPGSGVGATVRQEWQGLRTAATHLLDTASGPPEQGQGQGQGEEGDSGAPPPPQPPQAGPPPTTRVSLIELDDLRAASQDLSSTLGRLVVGLNEVRRAGPVWGKAMAAVSKLRGHSDLLALQEDLGQFKTHGTALGKLIGGVDGTISRVPEYGELRPAWVEARGLAMGIYNHGR